MTKRKYIMLGKIKNLFNYNEKKVIQLQKGVDAINALEDVARKLKDTDFPKETEKLKEQISSGEKKLDDILPWAFALVREAARRTLNMRHFDVQLMAAMALHEGSVIEQRTGEGKTLSATPALYLNALTGKGAHLVTVNDYLARLGAGWMGPIFDFLGVTTSAIISEQSFLYDPSFSQADMHDWRLSHLKPISRKGAYDADITYGINSEFGFDYLRDNMVSSMKDKRQRGFHYAVIDEVDSVLIDEARTPHIISAPYDRDTSQYFQYAEMVSKLKADVDFTIDEKMRSAHLTEEGIQAVEKMLGVDNVYEQAYETVYHLEAALKAQALFKNNQHYIVRNGEVIIVDEFTGRLLPGRRFSEGIHQAIEAKENVSIQQESQTLATVSLQNYFRMYEKLAGMTGTAATEAEEFHKIYNMTVVVMPTHRQTQRIDHPDLIYKTIKGKFQAVVIDVMEQHKAGRPVLIGTTSIDKNEVLSALLKKAGVPHKLLNAKNHAEEAEIIADAGRRGAVTVATNMAGRGVDIVLGGALPSKEDLPDDMPEKEKEKKLNALMLEWQKGHDEVIELGGLYVIGTERHESRRIDNQLRGRAGRQGDPGDSRFFVALEDDMMRIFGGEQVSKLMDFFKIPEDQPLEHSMVSKALESAQQKVEGHNFDSRKQLVEYDDVLNKQREIVYVVRNKVLSLGDSDPKALREYVFELYGQLMSQWITTLFSISAIKEYEKFAEEIAALFPLDRKIVLKKIDQKSEEEVREIVEKIATDFYAEKEKQLGPDIWAQVVRDQLLASIDHYWVEHLTAIDDLEAGIRLRARAQLDPLVEYKNEAFTMFEKLLSDIDYEALRRIFHVQVQRKEEAKELTEKMEEERRKMVRPDYQ